MEELEVTDIDGEKNGQKPFVWSLVLHVAHIPHSLVRDTHGWVLRVDEESMERARQEIIAFEEENVGWPPPKNAEETSRAEHAAGEPPTILAMGALLIFYSVTGPVSLASRWFQSGGVSSEKILEQGEWWRLITGLTLHGDPVHLLGNLIIGGMLVHFLCRHLGGGLGWALILLAGTLGNFINVVVRGIGHNSLGFSTAVFGAVGILCGTQLSAKRGIRGLLLPLGAAASLLGFLGTSGARTDLGAHLWGATVGIAIGFLSARSATINRIRQSGAAQFVSFVVVVVVVWICWEFALNA